MDATQVSTTSRHSTPSDIRARNVTPPRVFRLCIAASGSVPFCKRALRGFSPLPPFLAARPCPQAARRGTFFEGAVGTREVEITILSHARNTETRPELRHSSLGACAAIGEMPYC